MNLPNLFDLEPQLRSKVIGGLLAATLILLLIAALLERDPGSSESQPSPSATPAASVPAPPPAEREVLPVAAADAGTPATPAAVSARLSKLLADPALGGSVGASVVDAATGQRLYDTGSTSPQISGSTVKTLTAAAALNALGPTHRFETTVVAAPGSGVLTLRGGGDPLLAIETADAFPGGGSLQRLAADTAAALRAAKTTTPVRLTYDASLFTGPAVADGWGPGQVGTAIVSPVSALSVVRDPEQAVANPAARAAARFAEQLTAAGVVVTGDPTPATASTGATELASVSSPTLAAIVEELLLLSDNDAAEIVARHVGIAAGVAGSFAAALPAVVAELGEIGVDTAGVSLGDASGLSRRTLVPPATLTGVLDAAVDQPSLRAVLVGLPVAGFSGTLAQRFNEPDAAPGRGEVRAKTGTLTGVTGLTGTLRTADGRLLLFAFLTDEVPAGGTEAARDSLDAAAAALADCGC